MSIVKVLMYSTAVFPFCIRAEQLLRSKGVTPPTTPIESMLEDQYSYYTFRTQYN